MICNGIALVHAASPVTEMTVTMGMKKLAVNMQIVREYCRVIQLELVTVAARTIRLIGQSTCYHVRIIEGWTASHSPKSGLAYGRLLIWWCLVLALATYLVVHTPSHRRRVLPWRQPKTFTDVIIQDARMTQRTDRSFLFRATATQDLTVSTWVPSAILKKRSVNS